jgi:hypothetical protein
VNIWCGLLSKKLIGPFVCDNNLTGDTYEFYLKNALLGLLEHTLSMVSDQMHFQHDGGE